MSMTVRSKRRKESMVMIIHGAYVLGGCWRTSADQIDIYPSFPSCMNIETRFRHGGTRVLWEDWI